MEKQFSERKEHGAYWEESLHSTHKLSSLDNSALMFNMFTYQHLPFGVTNE